MVKRKAVTYSKARVFHDMDLKDADDLVLRADLMHKVSQIIAARGLTQLTCRSLAFAARERSERGRRRAERGNAWH